MDPLFYLKVYWPSWDIKPHSDWVIGSCNYLYFTTVDKGI